MAVAWGAGALLIGVVVLGTAFGIFAHQCFAAPRPTIVRVMNCVEGIAITDCSPVRISHGSAQHGVELLFRDLVRRTTKVEFEIALWIQRNKLLDSGIPALGANDYTDVFINTPL